MQDILVKVPLPPRDPDYFTTLRRRTHQAQQWEETMKLVFKNVVGCPVTTKCDVDLYISTCLSSGMVYNTGLYYILEQTPAIAVVGNICNIRFHYKYVHSKVGSLWVRISDHVPSEYPKG